MDKSLRDAAEIHQHCDRQAKREMPALRSLILVRLRKMLTRKEIIAATAAMLRCDLMLELWEEHKDELLKLYPGFATGDFRADDRIMVQPSSSYLILGVALLFAVIEFLNDRKIEFPESIRSDVESLYPKLREFRNCVFHPQVELLSRRQFALLEHPNSLITLGTIHRELGNFLKDMLTKLPIQK